MKLEVQVGSLITRFNETPKFEVVKINGDETINLKGVNGNKGWDPCRVPLSNLLSNNYMVLDSGYEDAEI
jgi:hypothetical protein